MVQRLRLHGPSAGGPGSISGQGPRFHMLQLSVSIPQLKILHTTMRSSIGDSGHPCLLPDFRGNAFKFLPLRIMFAVGLSYMAFIMLRYVPSMFCFLEGFYHKLVLNVVKGFLCL